MKIASKFASLLLKARTYFGYTQEHVAESVSISVRWYQKIESGSKFPSAIVLIRLVLFLKIDIEDLREEAGLSVPLHSVRRDAVLR